MNLAADLDRDAVEDGVAAHRVEHELVGRARSCSSPAWAAAVAIALPAASWPHPCGIETTPRITASVTSTGTATSPVRPLTRAGSPSVRPSRAASSGWTCSVHCSLPAHEQVEVVHPRVVGAQLAAADEHHPAVGAARERGAQPLDVGDDLRRRQLDLAARRAQDLRQARLERAEVDPVRRGLEVGERERRRDRRAASRRACARGRRAARARPAKASRGRRPRGATTSSATMRSKASTSTAGALAGDDAGQPQQRLPLVRLAGLERQHGRRVVRDVARRQLVEGEVVVRALERRRRRQDDVGVARRLVEVDVERDIEVERRRAPPRAGPSSASSARGCRPA